MRPASSRSVVVSAAVAAALVLVGCSSGGDGGGDAGDDRRPEPERSAERTSTTAVPARIDLSEPIPGGSLYGTPRPPLENTGDDYVAIFESLMENFRWLTENPDLGVISEIFVPGTPIHDERVRAYQYLLDNDYRWADEGYRLISTEVLDAQSEVVSLQVVQQFEFERVVDASGNQVGELRSHGAPETLTFLLVPDRSGHWRIADSTRDGDTEVQM
jgi:hypothetical protein